MKREILFRGKRFDRDEWVYGSLLGSDVIVMSEPAVDEDYIGIDEWTSVDPATVGQFSGLLDRNGRKIFEGDVLLDRMNEFQGEVKYSEADGMFAFYSVEDEFYDFADIDSTDFEIIGTIHDQKEAH